MSKIWTLLCIAAVLATVRSTQAEPPKSAPLVRTIQFDPHAKAARLAAIELSKLGTAGWRELQRLIQAYEHSDITAARSLANILAPGTESNRQHVTANLFRGVKDPTLRAIAARALADTYPKYADVVHEHLMDGGPQADVILARIAACGLTDEAALELLASPSVGYRVYEHLRRRDVLPDVSQLLPLTRNLSRRGLAPKSCAAFAKTFASNSDFQLLRALAETLNDQDPAIQRGAHYLLLTISGKRLAPAADIWRSWIDGRSFYEPPSAVSGGAVEAAVRRAATFLARDLLEDGKAVWARGKSEVGSTALAVLALRAAGVPADHSAIEKALRTTLLVYGKGDRPGIPPFADREVYNLTLLAMALEAVDGKHYTGPLLSIRDRLVQGQASNGQWTYSAARGTGNLPPLRGDNSNTQYALLALRAISRSGLPVPRETWEKSAAYWQGAVHSLGGWNYIDDPSHAGKRRISMTSAGIGSLAICLEGLHGDGAAKAIEEDRVLARALGYLGELLLVHGVERRELYTLYGVERAGMLTGVATFQSKFRNMDWYAASARHLLDTQQDEGAWGNPRAKSDVNGSGYGLVVDTAYAILFLQKATATISKQPARTVTVEIKGEKPPAPPKEVPVAKPTPATPEPSAPALIDLDAIEVYTNTDVATISGRVTRTGITVRVGASDTPLDADGRFSAAVPVARTHEVAVVALREGKEAERYMVRAVLDVHPPTMELIGGPVRAVGKQTLRFRASESLRGLRSGRLFAPADNNIVDLPVELASGRPVVHVTAVDRAGNESKHRFAFDVQNRVLVLDGKSAVRIDLKEKPPVFTVECWFRAETEPKKGAQVLVGDTERSGFALHWRTDRIATPSGYVRAGGDYLICRAAKRPRLKRWHHAALSYDGKTARFFVNGKLQQAMDGAPYGRSSRALFIGADPAGKNIPNSFFVGMIDEVRISRVVRYVEKFKPEKYYGKDAHTILLMHFDTDSPTAFFDDSPLQHTGKPAGAPRIEEQKR